jgi:hypothetical protein
MSLDAEQLQRHCETIIQSRRIKNKIVVLCEGDIPKLEGRPSPQSYGRMEEMPDANFYKACVPRWWSQRKPEFFNCGDRQDVIDTYFTILEIHNKDSSNSYLTPEKLFAIVDLDLQIQAIDNYIFSDTEAIFCELYEKSKVKAVNAAQHRIWVTGLIHKESYFLNPALQSIFDKSQISPIYKDNSVLLQAIYIDMADTIASDPDLQNHLKRAVDRIDYCCGLDCAGLEKLRDSWKTEFQNTQDEMRKEELILALLTIKKAKEYWNQIQPSIDWTRAAQVFRDQLCLEIGRFYSYQSSDAKYHILFFLETLHEFV